MKLFNRVRIITLYETHCARLTDLEGVDGQRDEVSQTDKVVGAPRCRADLVKWRQHQEQGDVLVKLNGLLAVELVAL